MIPPHSTETNGQPFHGPKLLTIEVLVNRFACSIPEILAEERHTHDGEARAEYRLSLGEICRSHWAHGSYVLVHLGDVGLTVFDE